MQENKYTKLSALVGSSFTVERAYGYTWKKWDQASGRMLSSEDYAEGFKKTYSLDTDKGKLDVGPGQLGNLLESAYNQGRADLIGKTFDVKSNGKTGIDIRYYLNLSKSQSKEEVEEIGNEPLDIENIPF